MDRRRLMMASGAPEPEYDWLKFTILTAGTIKWMCSSGKEKTISYRKNGGSWTDITSSTSGYSISVAANDVLEFKGSNSYYGVSSSTTTLTKGSYFGNGTATFNVSGDITTMVGNNTTLSAYAFPFFFSQSKVVSASGLILPSNTAPYCYVYMFGECGSLTTAPTLPATGMSSYCYGYMFRSCSSLTTAPDLPATTLAQYCYEYMFQSCSALTKAPKLSATSLASYCYYSMFRGCVALVNAPKLPATTLSSNCYSYMFYGCSSLVEAPDLPATSLVSNCYSYMFYGCSKLRYIKTSFTTTPSTSYTNYWVYGVAAKGVFDKGSATWSVTGVNGVPTGWLEYSGLAFIITTSGTITWSKSNSSATAKTVSYSTDGSAWTSITSATTAVSISFSAGDVVLWKGTETRYATSTNYYSQFGGTAEFNAVGNIMSLLNNGSSFTESYAFLRFFNGSKIGSASHLRLPASTYSYCYYGMFLSCTNLTTAPELPAKTLAQYCYQQMFGYCTNLSSTTCLATNISASNCVRNWMTSVKSFGTFYKAASMTLWPSGASGIPSGWTVKNYEG